MLYLILILIAAFVFLLFIGIAAQSEDKLNKQEDTWLFTGFAKNVYQELFPGKDPDEVARKFGINTEEYYRNCAILRVEPEIEKLVVSVSGGVLCLLAGVMLGALVHYLFFLIGMIGYLVLSQYQPRKLKSACEERRMEIESDLPRFLDLLEAELQVGLPIETAISILCRKLPDMLLAQEFLDSLNRMKLGESGWQAALSDLAERYNVETLTNFVLNITTAYNRGVSIADTVAQKNYEIKQTHILNIRERSGKITNKTLIPIAILQLLPMLLFLMFPTIIVLIHA